MPRSGAEREGGRGGDREGIRFNLTLKKRNGKENEYVYFFYDSKKKNETEKTTHANDTFLRRRKTTLKNFSPFVPAVAVIVVVLVAIAVRSRKINCKIDKKMRKSVSQFSQTVSQPVKTPNQSLT